MPDLVENPEHRFSRNAAQIIHSYVPVSPTGNGKVREWVEVNDPLDDGTLSAVLYALLFMVRRGFLKQNNNKSYFILKCVIQLWFSVYLFFLPK